ncbi:hypothetical protein NDU88_008829 [Pleurodeles waltl]|uniref:Uncharacterized protein n=1 Tax=Pleurodeles waltl TaxID=8319 RepID=A0AAV7QR35_PLEWA|nr:hypothetical protein NDU88_008829 [Pleurodeles waltl]
MQRRRRVHSQANSGQRGTDGELQPPCTIPILTAPTPEECHDNLQVHKSYFVHSPLDAGQGRELRHRGRRDGGWNGNAFRQRPSRLSPQRERDEKVLESEAMWKKEKRGHEASLKRRKKIQ